MFESKELFYCPNSFDNALFISVNLLANDNHCHHFVYPEALSRMPISPLWSVFFFIMMATLGFGSQVRMKLIHGFKLILLNVLFYCSYLYNNRT
jgi:hypothetical protein